MLAALADVDRVLGVLDPAEWPAERVEEDDAAEIERLIQDRNDARKRRDFAASDRIRDDLAARRKAAVVLKQSNAELEDRVRQRTAEITAVNAQLVAQNLEERWSKQALEHQNRYNLLIIDSITDSVFVVTKLMNISRMNPAAVRLGATGRGPRIAVT